MKMIDRNKRRKNLRKKGSDEGMEGDWKRITNGIRKKKGRKAGRKKRKEKDR